MNPIVYAIPVFMASILVEIVVAHRKNVPTYNIPDALTSLHFGTLSQTIGAFVKVLGFGLYVAVYDRWHAIELPTDAWWVWVAALLVYDLIYYWIHRFGHEVNCLWAAHQVHHSSEYYNLSTALRQSSTGAVVGWPFYLIMAIAGVPPVVFGVVALIDLLYQYWVHTELVGKLGWFDRVFVSPSNHRVHHGQNDYCIDRNYGGILVIWDRLFGTFQEERDDEPVIYGVRKPLRSYNAVWGNLHVWKALFADSWHMLRHGKARDAIAVFFAPPSGWHQPVEHLDTQKFMRFDTATPRTVKMYALVQYGLFSLYATHFIAVAPELSLEVRVLYAGIIAAGALSAGWLLEGRRFAPAVEALRLVLLGSAFLLLPSWFGWIPTLQIKTAVVAFLATSLAWVGVAHLESKSLSARA